MCVLERLAALFVRQVVVLFEMRKQPLFERRPFYARSAADRLRLYISGLARLSSQRLMVGTDTEKLVAPSFLDFPPSMAASTLSLRSFKYCYILKV